MSSTGTARALNTATSSSPTRPRYGATPGTGGTRWGWHGPGRSTEPTRPGRVRRSTRSTRRWASPRRLHVKPKLNDVAVAHDVVLAFDAGLAGGAGGGQRADRDEVVVGDYLGLDEAALEVGVDDAGRLRRRRPG